MPVTERYLGASGDEPTFHFGMGHSASCCLRMLKLEDLQLEKLDALSTPMIHRPFLSRSHGITAYPSAHLIKPNGSEVMMFSKISIATLP